MIGGLTATGGGVSTIETDPTFGLSRYFLSASTQYLEITSSTIADYPFSVSCWFNLDSVSGTQDSIIGIGNNGGAAYRIRSVGTNIEARALTATTPVSATVSSVLSAGAWFLAVGVFPSDTSRTIYIRGDGIRSEATASGTASGSTTTSALTGYLRIARYPGSTLSYVTCKVRDARFYGRALDATDADVMFDPRTRYDLYWQKRATFWSFRKPASGAYTLSAAVGSFSLSGQAAALKAARKISIGAGSFALSGQAVGLRADRKIVAAVGAMSLAGQGVGLRADRKIAAAVGPFTLAGQSVGLRAARRIAAAVGTFTVNGQSAGLAKTGSYTLTAAVGTIALSGQAVSLKAARVVTAGAGTFALSGQAAALRATHVLVASAGAFTLSGHAVNLTFSGLVTARPQVVFSFPARGSVFSFEARGPAFELPPRGHVFSFEDR